MIDDQIQVAGEAANGEVALEIIPQIDPDVVTMDINMPVMDGLTTLKHIMIESPKPTVMVSAQQNLMTANIASARSAVGADGIAVEVHPRPAEALSDGPQALLPAELTRLVADARVGTGLRYGHLPMVGPW